MRGPCLWPLPSIRLVLLTTLVLLHIDTCRGHHRDDCSPGLNTPGVTWPHGDIVLSVGSSLDIFCKLNLTHNISHGRNSTHLWFFEDEFRVKDEYISIVNETTIHLHIPNVQPLSKMFYCKLMAANGQNDTGVCLNSVTVGTKPSMVKNFHCYSRNWQNLNCTWEPPENKIPTKYTVGYKLPTRAGRKNLYYCPTKPELSLNFCFWDQSTDPLYRQAYETYYFFVSGENALGNFTSEQITFNHFAHVIPDPPQSLRAINETPNSALLLWNIPSPLPNFPGGLQHLIKYQDVYDQTWKLANTTLLNSSKRNTSYLNNSMYVYNLTNLPYANAIYDVKVYIKSGKASRNDSWSTPANITFRTKDQIPLRPPKTDIGSFEISAVASTRDVYIYWQRIFDWEQCGNMFGYILQTYENGFPKYISPSEMTHSYAKFRGISFNSYKFVIRSNNTVGPSIDSSEVFVPNYIQNPYEPQAFTKISFGNRTYELSWKAPTKDKDIVDYTIFWCDNKNDRPFQCTGFLNWTHVDKSLTIKNITVPEDQIYQFAISANTFNASSGMIWASCTVLHNKVGQMKSVWIHKPSATYIELAWKLECSERIGSVIGFRIYYCPIHSTEISDCRDNEPPLSTIIEGDALTTGGNMTNLKPYTTYRVSVSVLTKNGEGQKSEPRFTTTLEDAPTPPWNISVSNVTNTSAVITWNPPKILNGFLLYYYIYYNETRIRVEPKTNVTLTGLLSYSKYNATITACTVKCSNHSRPILFQTQIGNPGIVERPFVNFPNSSEVVVHWKPPSHPGGKVNHYEILVTQMHGTTENNFSRHAYGPANETQITIPDCKEGPRKVYRFRVRAINTNFNISYYGPWSEEAEGTCFLEGITRAQTIIIWVTSCVILSVIVILGITMINKICSRIRKMQGVEVKLPPGLDPKSVRIDTALQRKNFIYVKEKDQDYDLNTWSSEEPREHLSKTLLNTSDAEPFIQKKEDRHGRNPSGDSSGCSSGHESVSSSITSGTQISSDSGTEADQLAASPDGVFPESSRWDCSSLRQTSGSVPADSGWDQYVSMAGSSCGTRSTPNLTDLDSCPPTGPYSCLSTAPAWSSTSYISNEEEFTGPAELQSEYNTVGNEPVFTKPIVKGYVSLAKMGDVNVSPILSQSSSPIWNDSQDPAAALPVSYVMAGEHRANEPSENGPVDQYCRFGLRSSPSPGNPKNTGYVALTDTTALTRPHPNATASTFQPNGYVSHKQFDKNEMTSPIEPDSSPHTKVFPTSENPLKSPPASV